MIHGLQIVLVFYRPMKRDGLAVGKGNSLFQLNIQTI